jgi:hypothetical protein
LSPLPSRQVAHGKVFAFCMCISANAQAQIMRINLAVSKRNHVGRWDLPHLTEQRQKVGTAYNVVNTALLLSDKDIALC